jgi:hypothetical protein
MVCLRNICTNTLHKGDNDDDGGDDDNNNNNNNNNFDIVLFCYFYCSCVSVNSRPTSLKISRSNRGTKMRKLCTINNSAKSRPTDINIIPD